MPPHIVKATPPLPISYRWAEEPRSRLELNALRALGVVLNKREWWTQWASNAGVRTAWIHEMEELLVHENVTQVLSVWPRVDSAGVRELFAPLLDAAGSNDGAKVKELLQYVMYPMPVDVENGAFNEGSCSASDSESLYSDDEEEDAESDAHDGEDDSEDDTALDEDGNIVAFEAAVAQARQTHGRTEDEAMEDVDDDGDDMIQLIDDALETHSHKDPFGQIGWYVTMAMLRENLLQAVANSTDINTAAQQAVNLALARGSTGLNERVCKLIRDVLRSERDQVSLAALQSVLPSETREEVLSVLRVHFQAISELLATTVNDISAVLEIIMGRLGLPIKAEAADSNAAISSPGPVPLMWMSDELVPTDLKARLLSEVAALENDGDQDWDTNRQVLKLIDPSLFCGVVGETKRLPQSAMNKLYGNAAEHMRAIIFAPAKNILGGAASKKRAPAFQWLPCEVQVDEEEEGGGASVLTYINNLHPETHAAMYESIASIFTRFVPLFDAVLSSLDNQAQDRLATALYDYHAGSSLPCPPQLVPAGVFEVAQPQLSLKGYRCQVIVKMEAIHLDPTQPTYAAGDWKTQGTDAEQIVATGVYVFGCDNIAAPRAAMRVGLNMACGDHDSDPVSRGLDYGLTKEDPHTQFLGHVSTTEDRCFVFPNHYQFKTEPLRLQDPTRPGVCKTLTFYLVDPTAKPIASTAVVPPQRQDWLVAALEPPLKRLRISDRTAAPPSQETGREGLSMEQAKAYRLEASLNHA